MNSRSISLAVLLLAIVVAANSRFATSQETKAKKGNASDLRSIGRERGGEDAPKKKKVTIESRTWTNLNGRTAKGKYLGIVGSNVRIQKGKGAIEVPYAELSATDQQYVADVLESMGRSADLPSATNRGFSGPGMAQGGFRGSAPPAVSGPQDAGGRMAIPMGPGPANGPDPMMRQIPEAQRGMITGNFRPPQSNTPSLQELQGRAAGAATGSFPAPPPSNGPTLSESGPPTISRQSIPESPPALSPPASGPPEFSPPFGGPPAAIASGPTFDNSRQIASAPMPLGAPSASTPMTEVELKFCGSCNKEVSAASSAGGRCPHCGVYWSLDETTGQRAPTSIMAIVGGVFVVLVGLAIFALRVLLFVKKTQQLFSGSY